MDRDQKWMLGIGSVLTATLISTALYLSESKEAQKIVRDISDDIKSKM